MADGTSNPAGRPDPRPRPRKDEPNGRPPCSGPRPGPLPLWNVVVHHDEANDVTEVIEQMVALTRIAKDRAINAVLEARRSGRAVLLTTHRERAELYERQLAHGNVTVTLEAADKSVRA